MNIKMARRGESMENINTDNTEEVTFNNFSTELDINKVKSINNKYKKSFFYFFIKRCIDLLGATLGLIIVSPLLLIISVAIKLDSRGNVIFKQERVGLNGTKFNMYKFRSMVVNAEELKKRLEDKNEMSGPMFKMKDDPRITKVGKFIRKTSIDELPQLINIIKGEMSIVGPRPNLPCEVIEFTDKQKEKLIVKPGLTCYWQVMGRNSIDFDEWMELDLKYVKKRNIMLDFILIIRTFKVFLGDDNAS
jgi:lipopolysaccharide/colanic/teichoic acid biosynthesis glycosyltransferase